MAAVVAVAVKMRVVEFADRAGVSVDTIRFYQKQQLLAPPERVGRVAFYGSGHLDRLERVKELQRRGFTLAVIRRFLSGGLEPADEPLAAAVARAGAGTRSGAVRIDAVELAARAGVPPALVEAVVADGLLRAGPDGRFGTDDVRIVEAGRRLLEAGLPLAGLLDLAREHNRAMRDVADRAVELFDEAVRQPLRHQALSESERGERLAGAFDALLPAVSEIVASHFRRVLLDVAQEHLER